MWDFVLYDLRTNIFAYDIKKYGNVRPAINGS